jgi:hypothetical protein
MRVLLQIIAARTTSMLMAKHFVPLCIAAAFLVRLIWILLNPVVPTHDFGWYHYLGLRIASGQGYTVSAPAFPLVDSLPEPQPNQPSVPTAFWPIGYPAFLGGLYFLLGWLFPDIFLGQLANIFLYLGVMWLAYLCVRAIFGSDLSSRAALLLMGLYPNHIAYTALLSVEMLFIGLVLLGTWMLITRLEHQFWVTLMCSGVVFGLATLTKPHTILLPIMLCGYLLWSDRRRLFAGLLVLYIALIAVIAPWTIRNYLHFGGFFFISTNGGINLLIGNNPFADGRYVWNDQLQADIGVIEDEFARDQVARAVAIDYILNNIVHVGSLLPHKLFQLYVADVDGFGWTMLSEGSIDNNIIWVVARVISQLVYVSVLVLFILALFRFGRAEIPLFWIGPLIILYFTLIYMPFFGGSRFHFPMVVWMAAYGGAFIGIFLAELRASVQQPGKVGELLQPAS